MVFHALDAKGEWFYEYRDSALTIKDKFGRIVKYYEVPERVVHSFVHAPSKRGFISLCLYHHYYNIACGNRW
jgi:hypothetical protein